MADVKNIITKGIGANPGGLIWFLTGGLEAAAVVVVTGPAIRIVVPLVTRTMTVPLVTRTMTVPLATRTITVPPMGLTE